MVARQYRLREEHDVRLGDRPATAVPRVADFEVVEGSRVVVIAYGCTLLSPPAELSISAEHASSASSAI